MDVPLKLLAAWSALLVAGCDGVISVSGQVRRQDGQPIGGAVVTVLRGETTVVEAK